ncbi:hypothetical protein OAG98_04265, partial [Acidimicrobiales bacterium]|nr:hypothetical protein [Acidimicrobiales bacterium]
RPGQANECQLDWIDAAQEFRDSCDGTSVPPTGFGQPDYPVEIEEGRISIDFRAQDIDLADSESQSDE